MRIPPILILALLLLTAPAAAQERPMTWLDIREIARPGSWTPSPDGYWMLYTVSTPDWQEDHQQSDLYLVSLRDGLTSSRRLTFTEEHDETDPGWSPDVGFFVFLSDRGEDEGEQIYMMRPDGGEARKITEVPEGVSDYAFSPDNEWLVFRSGESGMEQLHALAFDALRSALDNGSDALAQAPVQLTEEPAGIDSWEFAPDGAAIYFNRPDHFDESEKERLEAGFTVDVRNAETPLSQLYRLELGSRTVRQLTSDPEVSVDRFEISPDGAWIGFNGGSAERYERNITGAGLYRDLFLMETATGNVERLTENYEVNESGLSFSPDSRWIAFSGPDDLTRYTMTENRIYLRETADRGGDFRKLGEDFDNSLRVDFWSEDGSTIYFNAGVKVTTQLHALNTSTGEVRQVTDERAALSVDRDEDSGVLLINYSDPETPPTVFTVPSLGEVDDRTAWVQLVEANPQGRRDGAGAGGRGGVDLLRRQHRGGGAGVPGGLSGRDPLPPDRGDPRRASLRRYPPLQRGLRSPGLRRRGVRRSEAQLPGVAELWQRPSDRHRRRLLHHGL